MESPGRTWDTMLLEGTSSLFGSLLLVLPEAHNPSIGIIWAPQNKECENQISGKSAPGPSSVLLLGPPEIAIVLVIVRVIVI